MEFSYGGIVPTFTIRATTQDLSKREMADLFCHLADRLGLTDASHERPDESYQVLWKEMMDRAWAGKEAVDAN